MKKLYEFTMTREEAVKESETTKNDKGEEITTTKEVKKDVVKKFFLRKPTRKLFDEAELYYGVKLAEGIKEGLLTRALLQKRFSNDGGTLGDKEKEEWSKLYSDVFDKQVEMQQLLIKDKSDRTSEEKVTLEENKEFIQNARSRIQEFEMQQSSLYDQTAENRARNKTILWWVLNLSYKEPEDVFFAGEDFDDKIRSYDRMEEAEDEFEAECINKFFYYVSFWYVSKTGDPEHFKKLIKFAEQEDLDSLDDLPADEALAKLTEDPVKEDPVKEEPVEEEPVEEEPVEEEPVKEEPVKEEPASEEPETNEEK